MGWTTSRVTRPELGSRTKQEVRARLNDPTMLCTEERVSWPRIQLVVSLVKLLVARVTCERASFGRPTFTPNGITSYLPNSDLTFRRGHLRLKANSRSDSTP